MSNRKWIIFLLVFCMGAVSINSANAAAVTTTTLTVSYIDVGQGDSIWIHDSDNFDILIDGGETDKGPVVLDYLRDHAVDDIDVMIATHPDSDHIGGLIDVLDATDIPVLQVLYNGYAGTTGTWNTFVTAVVNNGNTLTVAQYPGEYTWGSTTAYILSPVSGLSSPTTNNASIVILLKHGNINFMFPGDISTSVENTVLAHGIPVAAQILKVAHHGSDTSSSPAFISAVHPLDAIFTVAANDTDGHPSPIVVSRLIAAGARVWRTDQSGTIVAISNGTTYTIEPSNGWKIYLPLILKTTPTPASSGNVVISSIFFDGTGSTEPDEYVEIRNDDTRSIQLQNWTLRDTANHVYTFPSFVVNPAQVCRIYTNQTHPESCGFNYGSGAAIWGNTGDCAYLRDSLSTPIDDYCY
jgi:competence protein ComEC